MTKQKKHKKRVRAAMKESGERYTEANAKLDADDPSPPPEIDATIDLLVRARSIGVGAVSKVLGEFHKRHHQDQGEWMTTFGSHAVEHLWPADRAAPDEDGLRDLLTRYRESRDLPEAGVIFRSEHHVRAAAAYTDALRRPHHLPPMDWTPTPGDEDDVWYDRSQPVAELGPGDLEGLTVDEALQGMWEYAPDVGFVFGMGHRKRYGWDREDVPTQLRQGGASLVVGHGGSFQEKAVISSDKPLLITTEGDGFKPSDGTVKVLDREIQRLRDKLVAAGLDPDA